MGHDERTWRQCDRPLPWPTRFCACCFWRRYVLVSRVRTLDSLRLLQADQDGLRSLSGLKHDEYLAAWERGYDHRTGRWSDALAVAALRSLRQKRLSRKAAASAKPKTSSATVPQVVACAVRRSRAGAADTAPAAPTTSTARPPLAAPRKRAAPGASAAAAAAAAVPAAPTKRGKRAPAAITRYPVDMALRGGGKGLDATMPSSPANSGCL